MAKKNRKQSSKGFVLSVIVLILGMSIGFFLLSLVYTGPNWVKFIVFIAYVFIVFFLIKFSIAFVKSLSNNKNIDIEDRNKN